MNGKLCLIAIVYLLFSVSHSLHCVGEKTMRLGGDTIWKMADYRQGIIQQSLVRTNPVLMLSDNETPVISGSAPDIALSFDEGHPARFRDSVGHYRVSASSLLGVVDHRYARSGAGAALFPGTLTLEAQSAAALFAPDNHIYDFSIEFWLYPLTMENGEQILRWTSSTPVRNNDYGVQLISCVSSKNRLQWSFTHFFKSPDGINSLDININGVSAVVPKTWSHHLLRFDSGNGMLEYLVNGKTEAIVYASSTGREGGEVYTPVTGKDGHFVLGTSFTGMLDEFRIHGTQAPKLALQKYPPRGGRIETRAIDLGEGSNGILKLDASGGRTSIANARISNEFKQDGRFRFSDDSEMQFFIRTSDNPYRWNIPWQPVTPGTDISGGVHGRYVQLAVDFYPSASGESSPYLEELRITYFPDEPPLPPAQVTAVALDGAVQIQWKNSPDQNAQGYLVYYGTSSDDYFGVEAVLGASPIDAGKRNTITIDGLKNGTLYFFRVAAYSSRGSSEAYVSSFHTGEFSREVRARPLRNAR